MQIPNKDHRLVTTSQVFVSYCLEGSVGGGINWCVVEMAEPIGDAEAVERLAQLVAEAMMSDWSPGWRPRVTVIFWRRMEEV